MSDSPVDAAYRGRAEVIALLAAVYPSVIAHDADPEAPGWSLVYIDSPAGQLSWHLSPNDLELFQHVPEGAATWDGHSDAEKSARIQSLVQLEGLRRKLTEPIEELTGEDQVQSL